MKNQPTFGGVIITVIAVVIALYFVATVVIPLGKWVFGDSL